MELRPNSPQLFKYSQKALEVSNKDHSFMNSLKNSSKIIFTSIKKKSVQENKICYFFNPKFVQNDETEKKDFLHYYSEKYVISEGSSSVVKACLKKNTYEKYAVKIIRLHGGEELLEDFKNEFFLLRDLESPYLPKVYEFFYNKVKCKIHIVMELIEYPDLTTLVYSMGCLTEFQANRIFKKILEGIKYLHSNFICHRDLKPDNILTSKFGENLKIIDFNIAKKLSTDAKFDHLSKSNITMIEPVGNIGFAAPEMLVGYSKYTEQVDLWSLGVLLYFMLCGEFPYTHDDAKQMLQGKKVELEFAYIWEKVSEQAKDLVRNLLKCDPITRFNADQALKHPWFTMEFKDEQSQENDFYDIRMGKSHEKILKRYYYQVFIDAFSSFNCSIHKFNKNRTKSIEKNSKLIIKEKLFAE